MPKTPAYKDEFSSYIKSKSTFEERKTIEEETYKQSDRACAILQGSWIDLVLESTLKSIMKPQVTNRMFGATGNLGTFSAKIDLCFAFAMFGPITHHDLDIIRELRNGFAHCMRPMTFELKEISVMCSHLKLPDTDRIIFSPQYEDKDLNKPKTRFVSASYTIIYDLTVFMMNHVKRKLDHDFLP